MNDESLFSGHGSYESLQARMKTAHPRQSIVFSCISELYIFSDHSSGSFKIWKTRMHGSPQSSQKNI